MYQFSASAPGRRADLSVSQNFLTSGRLIHGLIQKASISKTDTVIEIGAGKGHITRALAAHCNCVLAWELDARLYQRLTETFKTGGSVRLFHQDFLKAHLPGEKYKVFANIPFSITTAILQKLLNAQNPPEEMFLVMEKGAAMRFSGKGGENRHSLAIKPFYQARIIHRFERGDFHPAPRVDVVMLHLKRKDQADLSASERDALLAFYDRGFQRALTPAQVARALREANLPAILQSGEILYIQWLCLFRCMRRMASAQSGKGKRGKR